MFLNRFFLLFLKSVHKILIKKMLHFLPKDIIVLATDHLRCFTTAIDGYRKAAGRH